MVTLRDIARRTDVSINTVSLVLRNRPLQIPVRQSTIDLIKTTAKELDYRPNRAAQMMRLKKSNLIGMAVADFCNPLFATINQALISHLEGLGYEILITDAPEMNESKHMEHLCDHQIEGLIVGPFFASPLPPFLRRLTSRRFPLVVFNQTRDLPVDSVTFDRAGAGAMAVRHLIAQGHRRIGCMASPFPKHPMTLGYRKAMKEARLPVRSEWIQHLPMAAEAGYALGKTVKVGGTDPTAYYICDDPVAFGFVRALHERAIRIPRDIALVSYGNLPFSQYSMISLSSIRLPIQKLVEGIVGQLLARLQKRATRGWQRLVLPGELIVRESSAWARREP